MCCVIFDPTSLLNEALKQEKALAESTKRLQAQKIPWYGIYDRSVAQKESARDLVSKMLIQKLYEMEYLHFAQEDDDEIKK